MDNVAKEEHKIHLEEVLKRLQQKGLELHLEKCVFFATSVEFLGQHMSTQGLCLLGTLVGASTASWSGTRRWGRHFWLPRQPSQTPPTWPIQSRRWSSPWQLMQATTT